MGMAGMIVPAVRMAGMGMARMVVPGMVMAGMVMAGMGVSFVAVLRRVVIGVAMATASMGMGMGMGPPPRGRAVTCALRRLVGHLRHLSPPPRPGPTTGLQHLDLSEAR